jgi:hypothetical protein
MISPLECTVHFLSSLRQCDGVTCSQWYEKWNWKEEEGSREIHVHKSAAPPTSPRAATALPAAPLCLRCPDPATWQCSVRLLLNRCSSHLEYFLSGCFSPSVVCVLIPFHFISFERTSVSTIPFRCSILQFATLAFCIIVFHLCHLQEQHSEHPRKRPPCLLYSVSILDQTIRQSIKDCAFRCLAVLLFRCGYCYS